MGRNHRADFYIDNAYPAPSLSVTAVLMHPDDVMSNSELTRAQKRELLASWASDARAVHELPALRQLDNGAIVRVHDVLRALCALDGDLIIGRQASAGTRSLLQRQHRRPVSGSAIALRRRPRDEDDDDPPPCPAVIAKPPRSPLSDAEFVNPDIAMAA